MAVSLPSDLVLDVMRNADPAKSRAAAARFGEAEGDAFSAQLQYVAAPAPLPLPIPGNLRAGAAPEPYRSFEQMLLRNLFEAMLPSSESGLYGDGFSGSVWRSMAADQFAQTYADAGGLGVARLLAGPQQAEPTPQAGAWPYFSTPQIRSFTG